MRRAALFACAGTPVLAAALIFPPGLTPLPAVELPGSGSACKAVTSAAEAKGCSGVEIDLNLTSDGVWVIHHDADFRGKRLDLQSWAEVKDALTSLDGFERDTRGERFAFVNFDLKERALWPWDGRLRRALASHRGTIEALAARAPVVVSSPVPARYADVHRWLARAPLARVAPAFELADYDAAQAARWGLPMARWEKTMLPVGALANRLYQRFNARAIPWVALQESTARGVLPPGGAQLLCWTRDDTGPRPPACPWTIRAAISTRRAPASGSSSGG